ncbi:hypothetical protein B0O99DRAFT_725623 [Bisporella sp. PMI_857]|nr:hypothetical protein B0O99DRAFT_725623 [Bisporella sp. PMI_857]
MSQRLPISATDADGRRPVRGSQPTLTKYATKEALVVQVPFPSYTQNAQPTVSLVASNSRFSTSNLFCDPTITLTHTAVYNPDDDRWADSTTYPQEMFMGAGNEKCGVSDMIVYSHVSPLESPKSNSSSTGLTDIFDILDDVNLDINPDLSFKEVWLSFESQESISLKGSKDDQLTMNIDSLARLASKGDSNFCDSEASHPTTGNDQWQDMHIINHTSCVTSEASPSTSFCERDEYNFRKNTRQQHKPQEISLPSPKSDITVCSDPSAGFETDSNCSEEDIDWQEDTQNYNYSTLWNILHADLQPTMNSEAKESLIIPILTPMKQRLVDNIMAEFWDIFNQEWTSTLRKCAGTPATASPNSYLPTSSTKPSSESKILKRSREEDGNQSSDENDRRDPKRPKKAPSSPETAANVAKFACPYRKHDPPAKGCELSIAGTVEGITIAIERRLKSRKKARPNQTGEERWKEIYQILFPQEQVPSAFFEPVQDTVGVQSPDSEELANYEEYSRRELPRIFRSALEAAVNDEAQAIEGQLRTQLVEMIQDCQARVFSSFRSKLTITNEGPTSLTTPTNHEPLDAPRSPQHHHPSGPFEQHAGEAGNARTSAMLESFFLGPPLQYNDQKPGYPAELWAFPYGNGFYLDSTYTSELPAAQASPTWSQQPFDNTLSPKGSSSRTPPSSEIHSLKGDTFDGPRFFGNDLGKAVPMQGWRVDYGSFLPATDSEEQYSFNVGLDHFNWEHYGQEENLQLH